MCFNYQKKTGSNGRPGVLGETQELGASMHVNSVTQTCSEWQYQTFEADELITLRVASDVCDRAVKLINQFYVEF